jgi:SAM-dependent methyltransferase
MDLLSRLAWARSRRFHSRSRPPAPRLFLASEPWFIDRIDQGDDYLAIEGWAFADPRPDQDSAEARFLINQRTFDEVAHPLLRKDVGDQFWQRARSELCGFRCVARVSSEQRYPDGDLQLTYRNPGPARRVPAQQSWFLRRLDLEPPFPDEGRRFRVIGNRDLEGFRLSGYTDFRRLEEAAFVYGGKRFGDFAAILDWGCGCGRISRYLAERAGPTLTGCDIDTDNVSWCQANLAGVFAATQVHPPLPFGSGEFDLVIGLSVFTHFRATLQDEWLAELSRITRSRGILLMTFHGETAIDYARLAPGEYLALLGAVQKRGLLCSGANEQIDGYADHENEYVNVFHAASYVRRHWSRYFDVLDILPGYIFTHDLAVLRKR